jgi:pentatricopeptide repeat protein
VNTLVSRAETVDNSALAEDAPAPSSSHHLPRPPPPPLPRQGFKSNVHEANLLVSSISEKQQEYLDHSSFKLDTFNRTFPAMRAKLAAGQLQAALELWTDFEWQGLQIYVGVSEWEAISRTLSQIVANPATTMTDAEVQQVESFAWSASKHSPSALMSCMARHIRLKNPMAALALYQRYSKERVFVNDRTSDTSDAHNTSLSGLSEIKPVAARKDPSDDRGYGLKLLAITAHAAQNQFMEAKSLFVNSYNLSTQSLPASDQFLRSHLPTEEHLGKKTMYWLQVFELAHLISLRSEKNGSTKLEKEIEKLGQRQSIGVLEGMYKIILSGLWGPWPWLAAKQADISLARPILMPEVGWAAFIYAFVCSGRHERASKIWDDIGASGITPGVACWNALIAAHATSNNLNQCKQYLAIMKSQHVVPNAHTYRAIIRAAFGANQTREALLFLAESQSKASAWPIGDWVSIHNAVIQGLLLGARFEPINEQEARRLFDRMRAKGPKPDKFTYNTMLTHYGRRQDLRSAAEIFRYMEEDGQDPDVYTFSTLLSTLLKLGREDARDFVFNAMRSYGVKANSATMTTLITDQIRNGGKDNIQEALELLKTMEAHQDKNMHPNEITYTAIIAEISRNHELPPALRDEYVESVVKRMESRRVIPNLTTLHFLITASLLNSAPQGMHRAMRYYKEMVDRKMHMVPDSWYILISGMEKRDELGVANELIEDMFRSGIELTPPLTKLVARVRSRL